MILGLRHVGIVVSDLEASLGFYRDILMFEEVSRADEHGPHVDKMLGMENVDVTTVKLKSIEGSLIELLYFHPGILYTTASRNDLRVVGISHIAITVADLDHVHEIMLRNNVQFISEPVVSGAAKVAFYFDPDGNSVELVQVLQ